MSSKDALTGVLPVVATPFTPSWSIDAASLAVEIDWLYDHGADGITIGMVSEIIRLSMQEREELALLTCQLNSGRGSVVVAVGAESTAQAVHMARQAEQAGATAVMAAPPLLTHSTGAGLREYYDEIIAAVSVPVIVQDASGYVGAPIPIKVAGELFARHGQRVAFKPEALPTGPRMSALHEATGHQARVFEGSGGVALLDCYRRGLAGTIPGPDLVWATSALWAALQRGDEEQAYRISGELAALLNLVNGLDGYVVLHKHLLVAQGVIASARARGPLEFALDADTVAEVGRLVGRLRAVVTLDAPAASR
jgi:dihydrodipicolinate synthase/N-acetylneuraminate lyase